MRELGPPVLAIVASAALAAVWIGVTAATGLTYHLFPAAIAGAPAFVRKLVDPRGVRPGRLALLVGLPMVAVAWGLLEAFDRMPTATFVDGQPGGVGGEIVVIAALGAFLAARLTRDQDE